MQNFGTRLSGQGKNAGRLGKLSAEVFKSPHNNLPSASKSAQDLKFYYPGRVFNLSMIAIRGTGWNGRKEVRDGVPGDR